MHWTVGIQTSVLVMDLEVAGELALATLGCDLRALASKPVKLGQSVDFEITLNWAPVHLSHSQRTVLLTEGPSSRHSMPQRS